MTTGAVYKDLLPIPAEDPTQDEGKTTTLTDKPTESHALAMEAAKAPEVAGAAQVDHGDEVVNLGWNEPKEAISNPLVGGLNNEDLWVLVRRFNKVRLCKAHVMSKLMCIANISCEGNPTSTTGWLGFEYSR
jgi:hypothetical protein